MFEDHPQRLLESAITAPPGVEDIGDEEEAFFCRTDRRCSEADRGRCASGRLTVRWDQRTDLLPMEEAVRGA
jgi:hypothetical protein